MAPFTTRPIEGYTTLAERLVLRRRQFDLSPEAVAVTMGITPYFLEALEAGHYETLPGEIYIKNFLRRYAELLALPPRETLEQFQAEIETLGLASSWYRLEPTRPAWRFFGVRTSWFLILPLLAVMGYLSIVLYRYMSPPPLEVNLPSGIIRNTKTIEITGHTLPEVRLFLNGIQVTKATDGAFREVLALEPGVANLTLSAERRFSRPRIITRQIIVE